MKRIAVWLVAPLMLASVGLTAGPASAVRARPSVGVHVPGEYTAYGKYGKNTEYTAFSLTLRADHTGTDHFNDTIVWSMSGRDLTMNFDDGLWTYLGTKTRAGFNSAKNPGTLSNVNGGTGTWYAIKH
jgi:hypothetical protein